VKGDKVGADDYVAAGRGEDLPTLPRTPLGRVQPVEANALLARTYHEPPAIIAGGLIPRQGLAIVGGPPKRNKSFTILQQAICRSLGWPWLGFATSPGCTVSFNAEVPERETQLRLRTMLGALAAPLPVGALHFVTDRGIRLDQRDGLRTFRTVIETLKPDLVQIDPLARFMSGDENSTREMGRLVGGLDELIQTYGLAVEIVHHTAKPSNDDPRDGGHRLRGSSSLFAAADSVLILDRAGDGVFKLSFELRHDKEPEPILLRRTEHLWLERSGPPADLLQVAAIVERLPLRYSQLLGAIQADMDVRERTAQSLIARAKRAGLLSVDDGIYRPSGHRNGHDAVHGTADYRSGDGAVAGTADV
jgi:hypothetical protein